MLTNIGLNMFKYSNNILTNNGKYRNCIFNNNNFSHNNWGFIWKRIFNPFFRRPILKLTLDYDDHSLNHIVEFEDKRWGELEEKRWYELQNNPYHIIVDKNGRVTRDQLIKSSPPVFFPKRRFINLLVENKGKTPAENCQVKVRLMDKSQSCINPSCVEKLLTWENGKETITIGAKNSKYFHLIFSQHRFTLQQEANIGKSFCGVQNQDIYPCAWFATKKALSHEYKGEDGLCRGNFTVAIEVIDNNGNRTWNKYTIKIDDCRWKSLGIIYK
jgi:hypothetical protein